MSENASRERTSLRFRAGMILLIASFPVGYGGLAAVGAVAAWMRDARWVLAGVACYVFSWVMFLAAFALSGREGVRYAKSLWARFRHRRGSPPPDGTPGG